MSQFGVTTCPDHPDSPSHLDQQGREDSLVWYWCTVYEHDFAFCTA